MRNARIMHIRCVDIIGHRAAQHANAAEQLAHAVCAHLPKASRIELNLSGVPSYSPMFIRSFWSRLTQCMAPELIRDRLHIRTSSHTLREAFEHSLESVSRRFTCPHFQQPTDRNNIAPQQA